MLSFQNSVFYFTLSLSLQLFIFQYILLLYLLSISAFVPLNEVSEGDYENGLRTCVCVCASVSSVRLGSKFWKFASSLSFLGRFWFCLFLSDRAWCGLQNFYTEFWNSLIMQIYDNLFKINEKCYSLSSLGRFWFCLFYLIGLGAGFKTSTQNFKIH